MGRIGQFFRAMFSEWASGLTGAASIPFTVAALWVSSHSQRLLYGSLAGVLLLVSAYRVWAKENSRAEKAESELADFKTRYFDERPRVGLEILSPQGPKEWQEAVSGGACSFWLLHLGGRMPTSIRFEPIPSKRKRFTINFEDLPFLQPSPRKTLLVYRILETGMCLPSAQDRDRIGDIEGKMLGLFLDDSPPELLELRYTVTVRFKDKCGEELHRDFSMVFDKTTFSFQRNTEQPNGA